MRPSLCIKRLTITAVLAIASTALTTIGPVPPASAAGTFDPTFAGGGRLALGGSGYRAGGIDHLPDDRFVTVAIRNNAPADQVEVRRFLPNGSPDLTFAGTGVAVVGGARADWGTPAIAVDPVSGATYVTAWSASPDRSRIWRFNGAGGLDAAWNNVGAVGYPGSPFTDLAVTPTGRLLASRDASIYRFNTTGQVDPSFGAGGGATLPTAVDSIQPQADRSILVSGHGADTLDVYHLSETGRLKTFGTNGRAFYRVTPPLGFAIAGVGATSFDTQNDGSIVVSANVSERNLGDDTRRSALMVVRFKKSGSLSSDFAVHRDYPLVRTGEIAVQANDKVVISAVSAGRATIVRLDRDGRLDPTWGGAGSFVDAAEGSRVQSLQVQRTGRVVAFGQVADTSGMIWGLAGDITPTCFGKLATAFGGNGKDVFLGSDQEDVIVAGGGKDKIKTFGGPDRVCADGGKDKIEAGSGSDKVKGGNGVDSVEAGKGSDKVKGGGGSDRLYGGPGRDSLKGGPGRDRIRQ